MDQEFREALERSPRHSAYRRQKRRERLELAIPTGIGVVILTALLVMILQTT